MEISWDEGPVLLGMKEAMYVWGGAITLPVAKETSLRLAWQRMT